MVVQSERICLKKGVGEERDRTHHFWFRLPGPNLYSTEVAKTHASRTYIFLKVFANSQTQWQSLRERKNRTRHLWILDRRRNLRSNEDVPE